MAKKLPVAWSCRACKEAGTLEVSKSAPPMLVIRKVAAAHTKQSRLCYGSLLRDVYSRKGHQLVLAWDLEEEKRQERIGAGAEIACIGCGCSETRRCASGGCYRIRQDVCSRCVQLGLVNMARYELERERAAKAAV